MLCPFRSRNDQETSIPSNGDFIYFRDTDLKRGFRFYSTIHKLSSVHPAKFGYFLDDYFHNFFDTWSSLFDGVVKRKKCGRAYLVNGELPLMRSIILFHMLLNIHSFVQYSGNFYLIFGDNSIEDDMSIHL